MKTFNYHSAKEVKEASKLASSNSALMDSERPSNLERSIFFTGL